MPSFARPLRNGLLVGALAAAVVGCTLTLDFGHATTGDRVDAANGSSADAAPDDAQDGAALDGDAGADTASVAVCGDGVLAGSEECDFGRDRNGTPGAGCTADCRAKCCSDEVAFRRPSQPGDAPQPMHCYVAVQLAGYVPWDYTRTLCKKRGSDLASITSDQELAFAAGLIAAKSFIGGYRDRNGQFQWVSGEPWFDGWAQNATPAPDADRVMLDTDGFHAVVAQTYALPNMLCERPLDSAFVCPDGG